MKKAKKDAFLYAKPKPAKIYIYCTESIHETPSKRCPKCKGKQIFRLR